MLGKIVGAALGGKIAKQTNSVGGTTGAMIGAAVPFVISRMSLPAMIALGVGGYVAKKVFDKKGDELPQATNADVAPVASIPQPKTT